MECYFSELHFYLFSFYFNYILKHFYVYCPLTVATKVYQYKICVAYYILVMQIGIDIEHLKIYRFVPFAFWRIPEGNMWARYESSDTI